MGDRDEFDRIVEHLDLDLGFLEEPTETPVEPETPQRPVHPSHGARSPAVDEEFYRRVDHGQHRPWRRNVTIAWIGIVGSPAALVLCTLMGLIAPRSVVAALTLVFIASAIYLISQLPDRRPDEDTDDGAVI